MLKQQDSGDYYSRSLCFELVDVSNVSENVFSTLELAMRDAFKKNSIRTGLVNLCSEEYYASINQVTFMLRISTIFLSSFHCFDLNKLFVCFLGRKIRDLYATKFPVGCSGRIQNNEK